MIQENNTVSSYKAKLFVVNKIGYIWVQYCTNIAFMKKLSNVILIPVKYQFNIGNNCNEITHELMSLHWKKWE